MDVERDDAWYEREPSTRLAMIAEIQRIRRRTRARPIPVLLLAALITGGIVYKVATRPVHVEAEIVLALSEGALSNKTDSGLPLEQLQSYVSDVLLPDKALGDVIERHGLYPLRRTHGIKWAINELRSDLTIEIWKNEFRYYEDDTSAPRSARIGLTFGDSDPDRAYAVALDIAHVVIASAQAQRDHLTKQLSDRVGEARDRLTARLAEIDKLTSEEQLELTTAQKLHHDDLAQAASLDLTELAAERKRATEELQVAATSRDALAHDIAGAGLDLSLQIVEERRPVPPEHGDFVLVMVGIVVGIGALLGSALVVGAFDSRVHDGDDVERLGLPLLGHVPGFPGDDVGALATRSAAARRVPSFERWRSSP